MKLLEIAYRKRRSGSRDRSKAGAIAISRFPKEVKSFEMAKHLRQTAIGRSKTLTRNLAARQLLMAMSSLASSVKEILETAEIATVEKNLDALISLANRATELPSAELAALLKKIPDGSSLGPILNELLSAETT